MKRFTSISKGLMFVLAIGLLLGADKKEDTSKKEGAKSDTKKHEHKLPHVKPPARFNQLKSLVGKWEGTQSLPNGKEKVTVEYSLTSAGTVLVEKIMAGTAHEMLSLYHGDKDNNILMTHYCALGNQPRMKLVKSDKAKLFKFDFLDGTSMKSDKDPHMHQLTITIVNKDHIKHDWVFFDKGKKNMSVQFNLKRKK